MSLQRIELENQYAQALSALRQLEFPADGSRGDQRAIDTAAQAVIDLREQLAALEGE